MGKMRCHRRGSVGAGRRRNGGLFRQEGQRMDPARAGRFPTARRTAMLLILEDNAERIARFHAVLAGLAPGLPARLWRNAYRMLEDLPTVLPAATLISLDHDLDPEDGEADDPGTG